MGRWLLALVLAAPMTGVVAEGAVPQGPVGVVAPVDGSAQTLTLLDAVSLRPIGPRLRLGEYHANWSFSPDHSRIALGMGGASPSCGRGICIVDLQSMTRAAYVPAPIAVEALAWLTSRRVVAVLQTGGILVADPVAGTVVRSVPLPFEAYLPASARTGDGLAVVMDARPPRLVVVDAEGQVRVALLRGFPGAARAAAGLAVDRRGARAFVFAAQTPVAEVDLETMRVTRHRVGLPRPPRAPAGGAATSRRDALWLGHGLVAVSGEDSVRPRREHFRGTRTFPAGIHVIDTRTWSVRTVERRASHALVAAGRLLGYTSDLLTSSSGVGLRLYSRDGRRLLSHVLADRRLDVEVAGRRAYAYPLTGRARALHVIDVPSGTVLRRSAPPRPGVEIDILGTR